MWFEDAVSAKNNAGCYPQQELVLYCKTCLHCSQTCLHCHVVGDMNSDVRERRVGDMNSDVREREREAERDSSDS